MGDTTKKQSRLRYLLDEALASWDMHLHDRATHEERKVEEPKIDEFERLVSRFDWISVHERLPKDEDWVLVHWIGDGDTFTEVARYYEGVDKWSVQINKRVKVTHWMPLPEPPEET